MMKLLSLLLLSLLLFGCATAETTMPQDLLNVVQKHLSGEDRVVTIQISSAIKEGQTIYNLQFTEQKFEEKETEENVEDYY